MKKGWSIAIVLILLAILIGAYSYIKLNPKQEDEISTEQQNNGVEIFNVEPENINKIEILSDTKNLLLEKENDLWIMNSENDTKSSQDIIKSIVDKLSKIQAEQIIEENVLDLSIYGLDKPYKIIVTSSDNKTNSFILGNATPTGDGYYFMKEGETKVYMVEYSYQNIFKYTYEDLIQKEEIPSVNAEKLDYVYISQKDRPEIEVVKLGDDNPEKYELWNGLASWKLLKPYALPRALESDELWSNIVSEIANISLEVKDFIVNSPNDLSIYGLDKPELELLFKDSDGAQIHLYFGNYAQDGSIYFKQENSNGIYTMNSSTIAVFKDINVFDITDKFAMILAIEEVNKVVVNKDNELTTFDLSTIKETDDSGNESNITTCKVDGKEYPEEDFKKLYQNFIGLMLDSEYHGKKIEGTPNVSIALYMNDGKVIESKYYEYNENYYIFDRNGTQEFIVGKRQIENVFDRMKDFFDGTISNK